MSRAITSSLTFIACFVSLSRATSIVWRSGNTVSGLGTGQTPYKITFVLAPTTALALDDTVTVIARNEADSADVQIFAATTRACTLTQGATTTSAKTSEVKKWSTPHFGAQLIITANGAFTTADVSPLARASAVHAQRHNRSLSHTHKCTNTHTLCDLNNSHRTSLVTPHSSRSCARWVSPRTAPRRAQCVSAA